MKIYFDGTRETVELHIALRGPVGLLFLFVVRLVLDTTPAFHLEKKFKGANERPQTISVRRE